MKKDRIRQLVTLLPGKDSQIGLRLIDNKQFENLKEIVDIDIKKLEQIEDETGEIKKQLAGLYSLSEGLNDYVYAFDNLDYEEF